MLETTDVPENGDISIRASPLEKVAGSISQINCFYTNAPVWTRNGRSWKPLCNRNTMTQSTSQNHGGMIPATGMLQWKAMNSSEGISKGGGGVALCARDRFDYLELNNCDGRVEGLG